MPEIVPDGADVVDGLVDGRGDSGPASPPSEPVSPWRDVFLAPLRGGAILGFVLAASAAAAMALAEGGVDEDATLYRRLGQGALVLAMVPVLGVYARRIAVCTIQGDRRVPWGSDPMDDRTTWREDVGTFAAVFGMTLLPAFALLVAANAAGAPAWVAPVAACAALAAGAAHLPVALAACALRDGATGAGWRGSVRAWRAAPQAARTAAVPAAAFLLLFALSFVVARVMVPPLQSGKAHHEHLPGRDAGRAVVLAMRVAGVWAAFATFRIAGLLARDVPEIREVIE